MCSKRAKRPSRRGRRELVTVESFADGGWQATAKAYTDSDGRCAPAEIDGRGVHRISFGTGEYFAHKHATFYPEVTVTFTIVDAAAHHHVPLLLSPYAYSTYRGS